MGTPHEARDRIVQIRIQGFRTLADVTLDLSGLTVLIGDNGSGKSTILEALETLRYFAEPGATLPEYFRDHTRPIRSGEKVCIFSVRLAETSSDPSLFYRFSLHHGPDGRLEVPVERLEVGPPGSPTPGSQPQVAFTRVDAGRALLFAPTANNRLDQVPCDPMRLLLSDLGRDPRFAASTAPEQAAIPRLAAALRAIEVHVPFDVLPAWAARRTGRTSASRTASLLLPATRLELLAANLSNAYHSLKNDFGTAHWNETLDIVRVGLGQDIDDVAATADAAGGQHAISVRYKSLPSPVPAAALSDGTLAYLAFVALARIPSPARTVLAFDEPELHLHPGLLARVVSMLEFVARSCPVVIATHSDRVLDALVDPAASAVLCELDDNRATRLLRPDAPMLAKWLKDFRGLGDLRSAGLESAVMEFREPKP
jgi:predicted ATPase